MTNLHKERIRVDDPGYPNTDIPERRDLLDWLGWTLAFIGLVILIVAVVVVIG
ncbi:MAG: hypothetical protein OEM81_03845 [Acidimicrobiia bacterium]|nr:hypothetical protein [Acidimicrobiia bacterium]MDH3396946.1 hypothetical protein [Acidimicrobiia bacterium]